MLVYNMLTNPHENIKCQCHSPVASVYLPGGGWRPESVTGRIQLVERIISVETRPWVEVMRTRG